MKVILQFNSCTITGEKKVALYKKAIVKVANHVITY